MRIRESMARRDRWPPWIYMAKASTADQRNRFLDSGPKARLPPNSPVRSTDFLFPSQQDNFTGECLGANRCSSWVNSVGSFSLSIGMVSTLTAQSERYLKADKKHGVFNLHKRQGARELVHHPRFSFAKLKANFLCEARQHFRCHRSHHL